MIQETLSLRTRIGLCAMSDKSLTEVAQRRHPVKPANSFQIKMHWNPEENGSSELLLFIRITQLREL